MIDYLPDVDADDYRATVTRQISGYSGYGEVYAGDDTPIRVCAALDTIIGRHLTGAARSDALAYVHTLDDDSASDYLRYLQSIDARQYLADCYA